MAKDSDSDPKTTPPPSSTDNQITKKDFVDTTINDIFKGNSRYIQNTKVQIGSVVRSKNKDSNLTNEVKIALTVLLVELASSDGSFDMPEYNSICMGLKQVFSIDRKEMQRLINQAGVILSGPLGTSHFAETLSKSLNNEQKQQVMEVVNDLIAADGREDGYETYLRQKYMRLLGI